MTTGLIQPKEVVRAAIKARILTPARKHWLNEEFDYDRPSTATETPKVKLPEEAGIARFPICPKQDKRSLPKPKQVRRYIITQKELRQQGFSRQEIQRIKNEVRGQ